MVRVENARPRVPLPYPVKLEQDRNAIHRGDAESAKESAENARAVCFLVFSGNHWWGRLQPANPSEARTMYDKQIF